MGAACSANGQRQTATLNHEISTMWETKLRTTAQKTSRLLMTSEEVTRPKPLKLYEDDDAKLQTINFPTTQGTILINLPAASTLF
jgi:hypothetical protein